MTPLHWAAYHNDVEVVKLLTEHGAKQEKNNDGYYPVDIAAFCEHVKTLDFFAN
jgi:ankyrin repeat protein